MPAWANVRDIAYVSIDPEESEVLFRAYEVFEVLANKGQEVRLRVFHDEWFGTGWEVTESQELVEIE